MFHGTGKNAGKMKQVFDKYISDFIIQEPVTQHENLSQLNQDSVNTIKVMSLFIDGVVHILSCVLKIGVRGERIDNLVVGGCSAGIDDKGNMRETAFDKYGKPLSRNGNGVEFKGRKIPGYENMIQMVKTAHRRFPYFGLVSWDIAIDPEEEPVMIEYNLFYQDINMHQLSNGPLFGDLTEDILKSVGK